MVSNKDVFGYLKGNVGDEGVLKIMVMGAGKAFISVAIIVAGIVAAMTLAGKYGELTAYSFIGVFIFFSLIWCTILLAGYEYRKIPNDVKVNYRTWKELSFRFSLRRLLYFDWDGYEVYPMEQLTQYILSGILGAITMGIAFVFGAFLIYTGAFIYAFYLSFSVPSESLITVVTVGGSVLLMSLLFIKLKWKKIFLENINWNLLAWCVCAAVVITMISFVAGVAIRRIAGYIGIEYTIGLVSIYVIITAIYVINDLRQWMDNKMRESVKKLMETQSNNPSIVQN